MAHIFVPYAPSQIRIQNKDLIEAKTGSIFVDRSFGPTPD